MKKNKKKKKKKRNDFFPFVNNECDKHRNNDQIS